MDRFEQEKLRILILDDQAAVRSTMKQMVLAERFGPMEFEEAKAGPDGLDLALGQAWDLVVFREGIEALSDLKRIRPNQLILALRVPKV